MPTLSDPPSSTIESRHCHPKRGFLRELNWLTLNQQILLSNLIVGFGKEVVGYPTAYALDFDVLHAYLFPSIQNPRFSSNTSLISYIITNCRQKLVLPPGCLKELMEFSHRTFPIVRKLQEAMLQDDASQSGCEWALLLKQLMDSDQHVELNIEDEHKIVPFLVARLQVYLSGFQRLNQLLRTRKLVSFEELFGDEVNRYYAPERSSILQGMLAAQRYSSRPISTERDAENLATVITINEHMMIRQRQNSDQPYQRSLLSLLTTSASLLRLDLRELAPDFVGREVAMSLPSHLQAIRSAGHIRGLLEAGADCAYRDVYGSADKCVLHAKEDYEEFYRVQGMVFKLDTEYERMSQARGRSLSEKAEFLVRDEQQVTELMRMGARDWYMRLRPILREAAFEADLFDMVRIGEGPMVFNSNTSSARLFGQSDLRQHLFDKVELVEPFPEAVSPVNHVLDVFKIAQPKFPVVGQEGRMCEQMVCVLSGELLFERIDWGEFHAFSWPVLGTFAERLELVFYLTRKLNENAISGRFFATFADDLSILEGKWNDFEMDSGLNARRKEICAIEDATPEVVGRAMLGVQYNLDGAKYRPEYVSLETKLGEIHIPLIPVISRGRSLVFLRVPDLKGFVLLGRDIIRSSHTWSWSGPIMTAIEQFVASSHWRVDNVV